MNENKVESLTDEEQVRFVSYFFHRLELTSNLHSHFRDRCIILLMLDAGLRVGEAVRLCVSDLFTMGAPVGLLVVRAEIAKTKHERSIPVSIRLSDAINVMWLEVWQRWHLEPGTLAFQGMKKGKAISACQVRNITRDAGLVSIGRSVHPHTLRHTFATRLMRKCNIRVVQQLLGHASLLSTQVYTHPNNQDLQLAIDSLNA
jgi:integrase/recombinase XerC